MIGVRVVCVLAVAAVAAGSLGDNALDTGAGAGGSERVVLVAPVLAPPRDSRTHSNDRSRQFPILVLLAQQGPHNNVRGEPEAKSLEGNPQPIYVKKLEDQTNNPHSREKRHLKKFLKGGGGGYGYSGGYVSAPVYHHVQVEPVVYEHVQPVVYKQYVQPVVYKHVQPVVHKKIQQVHYHDVQPVHYHDVQPVHYHNVQPSSYEEIQPVSQHSGCNACGGRGGGGGGSWSQSYAQASAGSYSSGKR